MFTCINTLTPPECRSRTKKLKEPRNAKRACRMPLSFSVPIYGIQKQTHGSSLKNKVAPPLLQVASFFSQGSIFLLRSSDIAIPPGKKRGAAVTLVSRMLRHCLSCRTRSSTSEKQLCRSTRSVGASARALLCFCKCARPRSRPCVSQGQRQRQHANSLPQYQITCNP